MVQVVSVTKKGQVTIPKRLRIKYGITNKALFEETACGLVLKPLPSPKDDLGFLKPFANGKTARELLEEARNEELARDKKMLKRAKTSLALRQGCK